MHSPGKIFLIRTALLLVYGFAGAGIFTIVERREETYKATSNKMLQRLKDNFTKHHNISDEEFEIFAMAAYNAISIGTSVDWTYFRAVDFTYSAITTIGYGHITPVTTYGKLFCIAFCLFGIPICLLTLKTAGEIISKLLTSAIIDFERKVFKTQDVRHAEFKCALLTCASMVIFLSLCSAMQVIWEKWTFIDAFYAWFITYTTVGFGDYIPFESVVSRQDGITAAIFHICGTFPALCGLCLVASVINSLFRIFDKHEMQTDSNACCEHCRTKGVKDNGNLQLVKTDTVIKTLHANKRPRSV